LYAKDGKAPAFDTLTHLLAPCLSADVLQHLSTCSPSSFSSVLHWSVCPEELSQSLLISLKIYFDAKQTTLSRKDRGMHVDNGTRGKRSLYMLFNSRR
jgi:hypothetical protein